MTTDTLGFFPVPDHQSGHPEGGRTRPTDTLHIPANASNKEDARTFLAFVARPDIQGQINEMLGQLPVNKNAEVPDDPYLQQGFELLSTASALAQFYDRDAPPEMAKAGMEGFQEYHGPTGAPDGHPGAAGKRPAAQSTTDATADTRPARPQIRRAGRFFYSPPTPARLTRPATEGRRHVGQGHGRGGRSQRSPVPLTARRSAGGGARSC